MALQLKKLSEPFGANARYVSTNLSNFKKGFSKNNKINIFKPQRVIF